MNLNRFKMAPIKEKQYKGETYTINFQQREVTIVTFIATTFIIGISINKSYGKYFTMHKNVPIYSPNIDLSLVKYVRDKIKLNHRVPRSQLHNVIA